MRHHAKVILFFVLLFLLAVVMCACVEEQQASNQSNATAASPSDSEIPVAGTNSAPLGDPFADKGTVVLPNDYFHPPRN